jgi:glycosyltransferase involved in cell wall biosynthesis
LKNLLSVCIPSFNEENKILRCLESITNQKNVDITEILVGINSSTDRTEDIVNEYRKIDTRVKIINSPKGKTYAWNALNAAAHNNLRLFMDGDNFCSNTNSFQLLLEEINDNDIISASLYRNTKGQSLIVKIINFPKKYMLPYPILNGNLYLMNSKKIFKNMKDKISTDNMPEDTINDDEFLQIISNKIKMSDQVFVSVENAENINDEITRFKRIELGSLRLFNKYHALYKKKIEQINKYSKALQLICLYKHTDFLEKILFPFAMVIKFFIFRYIHFKTKKVQIETTLNWK